MFCTKCGSAIPGDSFVCSFCGRMLDQEQIKIQKEMRKTNQDNCPKYLSDHYGIKKNITFNKDSNSLLLVYICFVLLILIIVAAILLMW